MTDTKKLESVIAASGYKKSYIAQAVGVVPATLSRKIHNMMEFKATEIQALCQLLGIGPDDMMSIFFAAE